MKFQSYFKIMVAVAVLALTTAAFAGNNTHKNSFQLFAPAQVNGTDLPAGDYTAKWDGTGPAVQVSIVRDGKTVATVPATVVESAQKASNDSAEVENSQSGGRQLSVIHFSGKTYSLQFSGDSTQARAK
jgi:hypothetical protein